MLPDEWRVTLIPNFLKRFDKFLYFAKGLGCDTDTKKHLIAELEKIERAFSFYKIEFFIDDYDMSGGHSTGEDNG